MVFRSSPKLDLVHYEITDIFIHTCDSLLKIVQNCTNCSTKDFHERLLLFSVVKYLIRFFIRFLYIDAKNKNFYFPNGTISVHPSKRKIEIKMGNTEFYFRHFTPFPAPRFHN